MLGFGCLLVGCDVCVGGFLGIVWISCLLLSARFACYGVSVLLVLDLVWLLAVEFGVSFGLVGWCCGIWFSWGICGLGGGLWVVCTQCVFWFSASFLVVCGVVCFGFGLDLCLVGFVYFVVCVALICDFPDYFVLVFGGGMV